MRGNRGNIGIAPPPESVCSHFAQSEGWRLTLGNMVGNAKGNDETMTGAHLGGRGVGRRRGSAAIAAPRDAGRRTVAAMVMGATIWIFGARFFGTFARSRDEKSHTRAGLEAMGFRVRRLPVGFCLRFFVFL